MFSGQILLLAIQSPGAIWNDQIEDRHMRQAEARSATGQCGRIAVFCREIDDQPQHKRTEYPCGFLAARCVVQPRYAATMSCSVVWKRIAIMMCGRGAASYPRVFAGVSANRGIVKGRRPRHAHAKFLVQIFTKYKSGPGLRSLSTLTQKTSQNPTQRGQHNPDASPMLFPNKKRAH